jgi:hypothetical protein
VPNVACPRIDREETEASADLKRRNLSYLDLGEKLATISVQENKQNISSKTERSSFTAVFLVQFLVTICCHTMHLGERGPAN